MNHEGMPFQKRVSIRVAVVTVSSTSTGLEPSLLLTRNNFPTYAKIQGLHQVNKFRVLAEDGNLHVWRNIAEIRLVIPSKTYLLMR